ncbi:MAG: 50S ribosomal protein L16 [Atribacterota bacterium]
MLQPTRTKYRKMQRGKMKGKAHKGNLISFGEYGLQALQSTWITSAQLESARIAVTHAVKRGGKVWIRVFPHKSVTKTAAETRMGKGKGSPEFWVAVVKPGTILFELGGVGEGIAREAMRLASHKIPIKTRFVMREEQVVG